MKNLHSLSLSVAVAASLAAPFVAAAQDAVLPAFPGAQGFGALATGGRGREVVHVTNLGDKGAGSLREAASKPRRTIVFDVGGVIVIASKIAVASDITLAGESAPAPGIVIYGEGVSFSGSKNIIVRYLSFRQGIKGSRGGKSINLTQGSDMIFDHVSALWGRWDSLGFTSKAERVTLQNSIIGEPIDPQRFGGLVDSARQITIARNLWIHNQSRNPKIKGDLQYINNIVYNWGRSGVTGGHSAGVWHQDMVNNLFIAGPTTSGAPLSLFAATDWVYARGNELDGVADGILAPRALETADFKGDTPPTFQDAPYLVPPIAVEVLSTGEALNWVTKNAGSSLHRDAVETRLIAQLSSLGKEGAIVRNENEAGGQPPVAATARAADFDTDGDGMPDAWETARGLDAKNATDGQKLTASGYSQLEIYLHSLCA